MEKEYLAMYDVRGIQNYIFRSNDLQEIIGASNLVENIIIDGLESIITGQSDWNREEFLTDWKNDNGTEFIDDNSVKMQVLFIGGGNGYVLFRTKNICSKVNRLLAKYILEHTYSLTLAVAICEKSESYEEDYKTIQKKMRKIKAKMPETKPVGIMPFIAADKVTGYPVSVHNNRKFSIYADGSIEYLCTESWLKREHFPHDENSEKILDNLVIGKGDNSKLALIHIDGNNMGQRLMNIMGMKENKSYKNAIATMRTISKNIDYAFGKAYKACELYVGRMTESVKPGYKGKLIRGIIRAGDDITFICNVKVAFGCVKTFIYEVSKHVLYENKAYTRQENIKEYGFSACAGIAYFNSHFPFRDAYEIAESCCKSAKNRAKSLRCREGGKADGNLGNFVDFQICMNVNAGNLNEYREKQYQIINSNQLMIFRPYFIPCHNVQELGDLNKRNKEYDILNLEKNLAYFNNKNFFTRSQNKKLRNAFSYGASETEKYIAFLKSRQKMFPDTDMKTWYDALEIMDYAVVKEGKLICV